MAAQNTNRKRLIINYLPQCMADQELHGIFSAIAPVEACKIMRDQASGYSFGYGFVTYVNDDDAEVAIQQLNGYQIKAKRLKVSYARPPGEDIKDTNLYIQNLPRTFDEDAVEALFSQYGTIVQKSLLTDKITGMPRGVAFVRFNKKSEADAAISSLNGHQMDGAMHPLQVKIAEEHGKSKAAYFHGLRVGMGYGGGVRPPRPMMGGGPGAPLFAARPRGPRPFGQHPIRPAFRGRSRFNPMGRGGFPNRGGGAGFYQPRKEEIWNDEHGPKGDYEMY